MLKKKKTRVTCQEHLGYMHWVGSGVDAKRSIAMRHGDTNVEPHRGGSFKRKRRINAGVLLF